MLNTTIASQLPFLPGAIDRIVQKFHPIKIILFGSYARGKATFDSDIDLLIVLPTVEHKRKTTIQIGNVLSNLPISKDIVVTTPEEIELYGKSVGYILRPALEEGIVIYESR